MYWSLELDTQLEVVWLLVALVIVAIVVMHHSHHLKLEITISVIKLMDWIAYGPEKAAQEVIHAAHSTTLHTSLFSFQQQPPTGLSYKSAVIKAKVMRPSWCCLLKNVCAVERYISATCYIRVNEQLFLKTQIQCKTSV